MEEIANYYYMEVSMKSLLAVVFSVLFIVFFVSCNQSRTPVSSIEGNSLEINSPSAVLVVPSLEYDTIQKAIDAASDGDVIKVLPGTYYGAVVNNEVHLEAEDEVIINDGPNSHSFLRAGFLFNEDHSGDGASIKGFHFECVIQTDYTDDGNLDFPIFSRGADNVTVKENTMTNCLQAITNWNGSGWEIKENQISDLWTLNGGGIGIFVGRLDGGISDGNVVKENTIIGTLQVWEFDGGEYNGTGVALYADYRSGKSGGYVINSEVIENRVSLVSNHASVVDAVAFEATDSRTTPIGYVIHDNEITENDFSGSANEYDFTPDDLIEHNTYEGNIFGAFGKGKIATSTSQTTPWQ